MDKKSILFIGPLPKPLGGVSVHIQRLSNLLKEEFVIRFVDESRKIKGEYFNIYSLNFFKYLAQIKKSDIIHIHSGNSLIRNVHILISKLFFKKIIITIHSCAKKSKIVNRIDGLFLKLVNKIVIVNKDMQKTLRLNKNFCVQYAFLPPIIDKEPEITPEVLNFIKEMKTEKRTLFIANAWRLDHFKNEDLYGLDLSINLAKKLIESKYNVAFIFVVASLDKNKDMFLTYREQIQQLNMQNVFLLINAELSFSKLITLSDVILRPTNSDGDALTIREAIYFNKPVIASNVVQRPEETILFETRDEHSLYKAALKVLENQINCQPIAKQIDFKSIYLNIYRKCVE